MSDDLDSLTVYTVKNGCPICRNDLKGNKKYKFYCKRCNLLFDLMRNH